MYVLDTNIIRAIVLGSMTGALRDRVAARSIHELGVSVITVHEFIQGTFSMINKYQQSPRIIEAYGMLQTNFDALGQFQILPFAQSEYNAFANIPAAVRTKIGSQDSRIAATAIAGGHTLVTANVQDFMRVDGLLWEDWTAAPLEEEEVDD